MPGDRRTPVIIDPLRENGRESAEPLLELGLWLALAEFPAGPDALLACLIRNGAPASVLPYIARLPRRRLFADVEDVLLDVRANG